MKWNNLNTIGKGAIITGIIVFIGAIIGIAGLIFIGDMITPLRIFFGSIYVLFIPGFILTFIFFPIKEIDHIERIAISFALSIAIVPLVVFYLNLIGLKISALNTTLIILGIIILELITLFVMAKIERKRKIYNW